MHARRDRADRPERRTVGRPDELRDAGQGRLRYQFYKDAARTQVFADRNRSEMAGRARERPAAARAGARRGLAGQTAPEGTYVDTVVVTVTY